MKVKTKEKVEGNVYIFQSFGFKIDTFVVKDIRI